MARKSKAAQNRARNLPNQRKPYKTIIDEVSGENLPHLPDRHVVALKDSVGMFFTHPHSKKKEEIKHTQVPVVLALAMMPKG